MTNLTFDEETQKHMAIVDKINNRVVDLDLLAKMIRRYQAEHPELTVIFEIRTKDYVEEKNLDTPSI